MNLANVRESRRSMRIGYKPASESAAARSALNILKIKLYELPSRDQSMIELRDKILARKFVHAVLIILVIGLERLLYQIYLINEKLVPASFLKRKKGEKNYFYP